MRCLYTTQEVRAYLRNKTKIAFVPTMGNLHAGHLALVEEARRHADCVAVSIFVNPMQFGPNEDYASYPRTLEADCRQLKALGTDLVFVPTAKELYSGGLDNTTRVEVPALSEILCGASRPGHFVGVTTVVNRLFNIIRPDVAVFGKKDYQQLLIIRKMVSDLFIPIDLVGVETWREEDGLALSSRNRYLTPAQRRLAPLLYENLCEIATGLKGKDTGFKRLEKNAYTSLKNAGFSPDYISIRHSQTLAEATTKDDVWVILAAARLGKTRLIDNLEVFNT